MTSFITTSGIVIDVARAGYILPLAASAYRLTGRELEVVRCVLNGLDTRSAAASLHIHRTTLYYRIDRIEALTGVNLRAGPGRDDLHLALRLAAYREAGG